MSLPTRDSIARRLETTLKPMLAGSYGAVAEVPVEVGPHLEELVQKREYTVRDGILTLLAMEVESGRVIDWRVQGLHNPARNASRYLGSELYPELHIAGSPEALQTGVKGVERYIDRKNDTWKAVLAWASAQRDLEPIEAAYAYLASAIAATARALPSPPALDSPRLTFAGVFTVLDTMLATASRGAHEQLVFAALLDAWREQLGEPGVVETKHVNASDASAKSAADVQEKHRGQVLEAYEITGADFSTKVGQAVNTLREHDLPRVHILARGVSSASADAVSQAIPAEVDVTVLDVREEVRSLLARLDKPHRRSAMVRLYWLLVDKQPDDALVWDYVSALEAQGLIEQT